MNTFSAVCPLAIALPLGTLSTGYFISDNRLRKTIVYLFFARKHIWRANLVPILIYSPFNIRKGESHAKMKLQRAHKVNLVGHTTQQSNFCTKPKWQLVWSFHEHVIAQMPKTKKFYLSNFSPSL